MLALVNDDPSILTALLVAKRGCDLESVSFDRNIDISLIQKFSPNKISVNPIKNLDEIDALCKNLSCTALVVSDGLDNLKDYALEIPILRPIVTFSREEIVSELEKYKSERE